MVRIKFRLAEQADLYYSPTAKRLTFTALADAGIPADDRICVGSPGITVTTICDNPVALATFELGSEYWFDITPVEEEGS
jgi:hypothetical protein